MKYDVIDALISPKGQLEKLSQFEVGRILKTSQGELAQVFRNCALAVLNSGSALDNGKELLARYPDFSIEVVQFRRGIKLSIKIFLFVKIPRFCKGTFPLTQLPLRK